MPCRWEASERPLLVRTVWVKGMRHALLTREELSKGIKVRSITRASSRDETSERREQVAERVCSWLASSRPVTPYGGSLWESPRGHSLDIRSSRARLSPKVPGTGPVCSPLTLEPPEGPPDSPELVDAYLSPPPVRTYTAYHHPLSAASARSVTFESTARPKLHIFMPDTRPLPRQSNGEDKDLVNNTLQQNNKQFRMGTIKS